MAVIDLQKAGIWTRISAYLFDMILTMMLIVGIALVLSGAFKVDSYIEKNEEYKTEYEHKYKHKYEQLYGIDFDIKQEDYDALSTEEKALYQKANDEFLDEFLDEFGKDPLVQENYAELISSVFLAINLSILSSFVILYFTIPLIFGNGQTLGKKIFGLAVIRTNCVKISGPVLFARSILGQCVIETMVPVCLILMLLCGVIGGAAPLVILLLLILQVTMLCITQTNSAIHDLLADTAVVDYSSQKIFESEEELIAYKTAEHEKLVSQNQDFGRLDSIVEPETIEQGEQE